LVVNLEKDPETGDLILPLPTELLSQMGWIEGTELFWIDNEDGTYSLKEKKNGTSEEQRSDSDDAVSVIRLSEPTVRSD
jgi:hypothetical protein